MATIFYSVSGEGRGHAARARVIVELLRHRHRIVVLCYGDAWDMLAPFCLKRDVVVRRIPGLRFAYDRSGRLHPGRSALGALPFVTQSPWVVEALAKSLALERADLALVDFEPLLPRAARLARIPQVALDHQQFLTACDLSALPQPLLGQARLLSHLCQPFYRTPRRSIISSFFFPPLRPEARGVQQVGVLLRREIEAATPASGRHLVAYVRRKPPHALLRALEAQRLPVRVYGAALEGRSGRLEFRPIHPAAFAEDLAQSYGLVTTAGNQVVGEALSLGKPVFAYPEPGNVEQHINAHYLAESGAGLVTTANRLDASILGEFMARLPELEARIDTRRMNGNRQAVSTIESALAHPVAAHSATPGTLPHPSLCS